jgi:thiol-disulfide isomerase/thioredoxin
MKKFIFISFLFIFLFSFLPVFAQEKIEVNFFYSQTCPHCQEENAFLDSLAKKYPQIEIKRYEVISNRENQKILKDFYEKYQVPAGKQGWVPVTFTPTKYFIGFNQQTGKEIESCLKECLGEEGVTSQRIKIPFFGEVDISKMSLPTLTVVFGAMDGFNPCAMWVLLFLIALLINTRSRKRMWWRNFSGCLWYCLLFNFGCLAKFIFSHFLC